MLVALFFHLFLGLGLSRLSLVSSFHSPLRGVGDMLVAHLSEANSSPRVNLWCYLTVYSHGVVLSSIQLVSVTQV